MILLWNPAAQPLYGYDLAAVRGRPVAEVLTLPGAALSTDWLLRWRMAL